MRSIFFRFMCFLHEFVAYKYQQDVQNYHNFWFFQVAYESFSAFWKMLVNFFYSCESKCISVNFLFFPTKVANKSANFSGTLESVGCFISIILYVLWHFIKWTVLLIHQMNRKKLFVSNNSTVIKNSISEIFELNISRNFFWNAFFYTWLSFMLS